MVKILSKVDCSQPTGNYALTILFASLEKILGASLLVAHHNGEGVQIKTRRMLQRMTVAKTV